MRELDFKEVKFKDDLEEIKVLAFGHDWNDEEGNYYWPSGTSISILEELDKVFSSFDGDDYVYMEYIFKYKDKFYSIIRNENSYGDGGFDTDTLKEVFPKEITKTIYE